LFAADTENHKRKRMDTWKSDQPAAKPVWPGTDEFVKKGPILWSGWPDHKSLWKRDRCYEWFWTKKKTF
jgi:hypothetical protein